MNASFRRIVLKATIAAAVSLAATLALTFSFVPIFGGKVAGLGLMMTLICPVAIGFPVSALQFWQLEKLKAARDEAARVNAQLERMHCDLQAAHAALAEKARRDGMTGALNRESFLVMFAMHCRRKDAGGLLLLDVDHFKQINDIFGHLVGDQVLRAVSDAIGSNIREGDLFGRIGGEEFAIFLPCANGRLLATLAERVREAVASLVIETDAGRPVGVTISIGGVECSGDFNVERLLKEADDRLYAAKREGRNRVTLAKTAA